MRETENKNMLLSGRGDIPRFLSGGRKFCLLNLCLDVQIDGVTYHLTSEFSEKTELGDVLDTIELERSRRRTA